MLHLNFKSFGFEDSLHKLMEQEDLIVPSPSLEEDFKWLLSILFSEGPINTAQYIFRVLLAKHHDSLFPEGKL